MREIQSITIFDGMGHYTLNQFDYDKIVDSTLEYPDSIEVIIHCYRKDKIVRTFYNPSCGITYKESL